MEKDLTLSITLPNFEREFQDNVTREIVKRINKIMPRIIDEIRDQLSEVIVERITESDVYQSLHGGDLQGELGVRDAFAIDAIIDEWAYSIKMVYRPSRSKNLFGRITIGFIRNDYSDVLTMPEASYYYNNGRTEGTIEWLEWLLLEGTSIIVGNFDFEPSSGGRTGLGTMQRGFGDVWAVPDQYAGTREDNFVTKALNGIDEDISRIVEQTINRRS